MILSATALYFYTKALMEEEIEEGLYSNKDRVEKLLANDYDLKGIPPIMVVEKVTVAEKASIKDTLLYDPFEGEEELFRQLSGTKNINGQEFRITVRSMVIESEDILFAIVFTFVTIIFFAFIFLFYFNKTRTEKLWKPFFVNLEKLKEFSIKSNESLNFEESDIVEFDDLNREMENLTLKVQMDYKNLKQFTEDVSHELQTPLAIMQVRIETLFNDPQIVDSQFEQLSALQDDINRIKKLNKKLILLAKIENNQFTETTPIIINSIFEKSIKNFKELTSASFDVKNENEIQVIMDSQLAIILCNNLLSNAIKYSESHEPIIVVFKANQLQVINKGTVALREPKQIFDRFYKEGNKRDATGLGLSIVKKICDYYGFFPSYHFEECSDKVGGNHIFQIDFQL